MSGADSFQTEAGGKRQRWACRETVVSSPYFLPFEDRLRMIARIALLTILAVSLGCGGGASSAVSRDAGAGGTGGPGAAGGASGIDAALDGGRGLNPGL